MSKDQYEVLEQLGTGSYGTVFKVRRKADEKVLVWKEINFGTMTEKEKSQLVAEVNILRELRNPFVVRYHDRIVDKPKTRLYIIMEYCSGGDLGRIIKKCKQNRTNLDENLIWKILAQCVIALKDCHRRQENGEMKPILHRDLKPANILLDASQNIKMGDFGLAKELSSQSRLAQTNVGTPFYMAPEIINEKEYDEKSDIWALGCLVYELAALKPPFDGTNVVNLAMKINSGRFMRIPSKYSDNLFETIRSMLQVDPRRRPRVEDLESLPALQPAMSLARSVHSDYKQQQQFASKWRDLKAREDSLNEREEAVRKQEASIRDKEERLTQWEKELSARQNAFQPTGGNVGGSKQTFSYFSTQQAAEGADAVNKEVLTEEQRRARRISMERTTEQMCMDDDSSSCVHSSADTVVHAYISVNSSVTITNTQLADNAVGGGAAGGSAAGGSEVQGAGGVNVSDSVAPPRPATSHALQMQNRCAARPLPFTVYCDPPLPPPPSSTAAASAGPSSGQPLPPPAPRSGNARVPGSVLSNNTITTSTAANGGLGAGVGGVRSKYTPAVLVTGSEYCKENQATFGDFPFPLPTSAPSSFKDRNKEAIYRKIGGVGGPTYVGAFHKELPNAAQGTVAPRRALADLPVSLHFSAEDREEEGRNVSGSVADEVDPLETLGSPLKKQRVLLSGGCNLLGVAKPTSFAPGPAKVQVDLQALLRRR